jgi:hypothetical protein
MIYSFVDMFNQFVEIRIPRVGSQVGEITAHRKHDIV